MKLRLINNGIENERIEFYSALNCTWCNSAITRNIISFVYMSNRSLRNPPASTKSAAL